MKFEEALSAMRAGKRVRPVGISGYWYFDGKELRHNFGNDEFRVTPSHDEIMMEWEIVDEPNEIPRGYLEEICNVQSAKLSRCLDALEKCQDLIFATLEEFHALKNRLNEDGGTT